MEIISNLKYYIWISECIKYTNIQKVIDNFSSPKDVYASSEETLLNFLPRNEVRELLKRDLGRAEQIIESCRNLDITTITIDDDSYPNILANIENPPLVLYVKGRLPDLDSFVGITIVGTRDPTPYGSIIAKSMAQELAKTSAIIVSGMAQGIDCIANHSAIRAGYPTVAVLGCSVDVCFPKSNRKLMDDIIAVGAVVSEFPPTTGPLSQNFPQRNRIMSGLSRGTLIVEAPIKSGALITATRALEQDRDVFAIPGNIDNKNSKGCNELIKNGAKMVTTAWDIVSEYSDELTSISNVRDLQKEIYFGGKIQKFNAPPMIEKTEKPSIPKAKIVEKAEIIKPNLPEIESKIYDIILDGADNIDEIVLKSNLKTAQVAATVSMLELQGIVLNSENRFKIKEK